jgi:hypothetical protein
MCEAQTIKLEVKTSERHRTLEKHKGCGARKFKTAQSLALKGPATRLQAAGAGGL